MQTFPSLQYSMPVLTPCWKIIMPMKGQKGNSARGVAEAIKVATCALPAAVTKRGSVATAPATTSTAAATATAPATTTATATSSAATVADHLSETGIDLLLGLLEHVDEVTSLLGIWKQC
jgi:hypothetical protein